MLEALVASTITLGGLLGLGLMLLQAMTTTSTTKAREQGVSVQRELVEAVRSIPYDELTAGSVVGDVQDREGSGLSDSADTGGWTVRRRGITYTLAVGVCSVDDPADGLGTHDPASFCATGTGSATPAACTPVLGADAAAGAAAAAAAAGVTLGDCGIDADLDGAVDGLVEAEAGVCLLGACPAPSPQDDTPDDYKRLVTLVRWDRGQGVRAALQSTIVPNPGLSTAPRITDIAATGSEPVLSGTSLSFSATADRPATAVRWSVDGTVGGDASGGGTGWSFTWALGHVGSTAPNDGEVLDGSYVIGAKAFDENGSPGQQRAVTVRVNRRAPYAPLQAVGGRDGAAVELQWRPSPERDVVGYRVYRETLLGALEAACGLTRRTSCRHADAPAGQALVYRVVAVDRDAAGALREGAASAPVLVAVANTPPAPPSGLVASAEDGNTVLRWQPSSGDPDAGDAVDHYRVYRDGVVVDDRYDRTGTAQELTFTDARTNGLPHTYWVAAVDTQLGESAKLGPVSP